ncbi:MAG: TonB-dependent receptor [Ignavibacteriaceae bacterium]|nr:TonB-dependent receptor [Ignavibacteriaceae bacterium]
MKNLFIIILLALSFVNFMNAQQKDTLSFKYPSDIQITAPRMNAPLNEIPFATSIIGTDILNEIPRTISLDEAVKLVPGLKVDNQSDAERIHVSIRGQGILTERGTRGINVLVDGIPMNDPTGFVPDFFNIDFNNVEKIEVLRGSAAALFGGSASGGIISVTTQNAPHVPLFGEVFGTGGSNGFWKAAGKFGGESNNTNYLVNFSRTMGDGYRQHEHFWGNFVSGKMTYTPSENVTLTPLFTYTDMYHENPEGVNDSLYTLDPKIPNGASFQDNEYIETSRITTGLTGIIKFAENQDVRFDGYVKRGTFTESSNGSYNIETLTTPGASVQYDLGFGSADGFYKNTISAGIDLSGQNMDQHNVAHFDQLSRGVADSIEALQKIKQTGLGLFLSDKIDFGKEWSAMLSIRYDKIHNELTDAINDSVNGSADFNRATGRIGVTYSPMKEINFFANWGQGFLPPATDELLNNPNSWGGFNKSLTFATSNSYDLGLRGALLNNNLYYDLSGFYETTNNDFDRFRIPVPGRDLMDFYKNVGSTRRIGLEFYGAYFPVKDLEFQVAYTYSNFKYTNSSPIQIVMDDPTDLRYISDGNYLPNSPMHQLYVDLQYTFIPGLSAGVSAETYSKAYIDGANIESEAVPAYTLLHARIIYKLPIKSIPIEVSLSGRNLGNVKYVAFSEPDPSGNSYQAGAGSEYFAGLRLRF